MHIFNFLDNAFSEHTFLSVAFSGFGIACIPVIFSIAKKVFKSRKGSQKQAPVSEPETAPEPASSFPDIENDISEIKNSLRYHLRQTQKETFSRYFHKYKGFLETDDRESLKKQASEFYPDYSDLLSQLLGHIEALNINTEKTAKP